MPLDMTDRDTLMMTLPHGGRVVEVGVCYGDFTMEILAFNQPSELFAVDTWEGPWAVCYDEAHRRLAHLAPRIQMLRLPSIEAANTFADNSLHIVYIDADHMQCAADIAAWWPKLKPGGWLTGHDYTTTPGITVEADVNAFVQQQGLQLLITNDITHDTYSSWVTQKPT